MLSYDFNPHPHVEGDCASSYRYAGRSDISIHTLAWRVTFCPVGSMTCNAISIHTLTWRVTGAAIFASTTSWNFNPHPHAEGDAGASFESMHMAQFQSTSSHGGWPLHLVYLIPKYSIYRTWCNFIQLICWKSLSISTTYYLFECESLLNISDTCNSHLPMY